MPAGLLATVGVLTTAVIVAALARVVLGVGWVEGLLLGAAVSSTDAAAVFAQFSASQLRLESYLFTQQSFQAARDHLTRLRDLGARSAKIYQQSQRDRRQWYAQACRDLQMLCVAEGGGDPGVSLGLGVLQRLLEGLPLFFGKAHAAGELLGVDHDPLDPRRDLQRVVLDVLAGPAEDRVQQLLLGRQLGLALRRDLADQDVARVHFGADVDDAGLVEVAQGFLADVRDVAGDVFRPELRVARHHLELVDVDRREHVVLHDALGDEDRVLVVVAVPGHKRDQHVAAQRQLAELGRRAVGDDVALRHGVADLHQRTLVDAGRLVGALVFHQAIDIDARLGRIEIFGGTDHDTGGIDLVDHVVLGDGRYCSFKEMGRL